MSRFGKNGARCDECGVFSSDEQGYYVDKATGRGGNITTHGRNCDHDFCDPCDEKLYPSGACSKCGAVPDGYNRDAAWSVWFEAWKRDVEESIARLEKILGPLRGDPGGT